MAIRPTAVEETSGQERTWLSSYLSRSCLVLLIGDDGLPRKGLHLYGTEQNSVYKLDLIAF